MMVNTMSNIVRKVYKLHVISLGKSIFYFTCMGFLAEDSKIDRATRLFEIFHDDQLIPYKNSQNNPNLFPMIFLKLKGLGVQFSLDKTRK